MGRRFGLAVVAFAAFAAIAALACGSFDAVSDGASAADGGLDASPADGGAAPDASPVDDDAGCHVALDEDFSVDFGVLSDSYVSDGGVLEVAEGGLGAEVPRPAGGQAQVENPETPLGTEHRYKLRFVLRNPAPAASGDRIRVGCTLKLLAGANDVCDIFAVLVGTKLRADENCSVSTTTESDLHVLDGGQGDLLVTIDTLLDPNRASFTSVLAVDGGTPVHRPPIAFAPDRWQIKCGIDESSLSDAGDKPYRVTVGDVHLDVCNR